MAVRAEQSVVGNRCIDYNTIIDKYNGDIIENQDGTVSVYMDSGNGVAPVILSKACCEYLGNGYFFDIETQKCRWSAPSSCNLQDAFKLVLNPKGNDGEVFNVEEGDECFLTVDFNYLFKVKCETLNAILNTKTTGPIKVTDPKTLEELKALESQLAEQTKICSTYTNQLAELTYAFNNTSYSIICQSTPTEPTVAGPIKIRTAGTSAFGKIAPFGFSDNPTLAYGQLYCINEPDGLNQWRTILGEIRYANFIAGDQTSYTCTDVQALFDLNAAIINDNMFNGGNSPELMVACDTPLNTKSDLMERLTKITLTQSKCAETISSLNSQIKNLDGGSTPVATLCESPLDFFETFDVSMSVDVVTSANTLESVYTQSLLTAIGDGNLYNYLVTNPNSGFFVCGDPDCTPLILDLTGGTTESNTFTCEEVRNNLVEGLFNEYGGTDTVVFGESISPNAFSSQWLHYSGVINDPTIIAQIINQKIKISININHTCGDFCVLVDNIELNKVCTRVKDNNIFLTQSPGFELDRIRDNKKSWVANTTPVNRPFVITNNNNGNPIRQTNYNVNDERLVINTKEIDLDINLAGAIETDIWCYLVDNPCLLTGVTNCFPCIDECGSKNFQDDECFAFMDGDFYDFMDGLTTGNTSEFNDSNCCGDDMIDFKSLMTQSLSAVTTIEDFEYFLTSELIDAKNRQTLSGYPTLRALYDRYMNSGLYCGNESSKFDYMTMDQFAGLVGTYWVDIVEQVIPATTIWGSTKIYSNTIFDQQKFKYRGYSSLFCGNPYSGQTILSPINGTSGQCASVEVATTPIVTFTDPAVRMRKPVTTYCNSLCIAQMNSANEFIGTVSIVGSSVSSCDNETSINESLTLSVNIDNYTDISLNIIGAQSPISYIWSNGDTGSTTTMTAGTYSVTVTDVNCSTGTLVFDVPPIPLVACWYSMEEKAEWLLSNIFTGCGLEYSSVTFMVPSISIGGIELITGTGYSKTITESTINVVPAANNVVSGCSISAPTGYTYTDFVDLLNEAFVDLGLVDYTAQVSLVEVFRADMPYVTSPVGFYIIRPENAVFTIKTTSDIAVNNMVYTENSIANQWGGPFGNSYEAMCCLDITLVDGIVIE